VCRGGGWFFRFEGDDRGDNGGTVSRSRYVLIRGDSAGSVALEILLVVIGFDDIAHDRAGSGAAVLPAFLHQNGNDNFGIAARGVTDKPGVVFKLLPLSSTPASFSDAPVPPSLTTAYMASVTFSMVCSESANFSSPTFCAFLTMCGCLKTPPEAMPPIILASCKGVVVTAPWPVETEMVSPAYHLRWKTRSTHSSEGMSPVSSEGRSIPVL